MPEGSTVVACRARRAAASAPRPRLDAVGAADHSVTAMSAGRFPERFIWVPDAVRNGGPAYDVGQMWVKFAEAIRTGAEIEPDFDHAVRRHRSLDAIVRASETGERQKVILK